eukprot:m51a1_g1255 hypothetical protein (230) ;mRNA; r:42450-43255
MGCSASVDVRVVEGAARGAPSRPVRMVSCPARPQQQAIPDCAGPSAAQAPADRRRTRSVSSMRSGGEHGEGLYDYVLSKEFLREYGTGVPRLDVQHKCIADTIAQLYTTCLRRDEPEEKANMTRLMFIELMSSLRLNFLTEEGLMLRMSYPGYAEHKREHEAIEAFVNKAAREFDLLRSSKRVTVSKIEQTFVDHMGEMDRVLGSWLSLKSTVDRRAKENSPVPASEYH